MKINKIHFKNFKIYKGENEIILLQMLQKISA
jgi:hypothetical protein